MNANMKKILIVAPVIIGVTLGFSMDTIQGGGIFQNAPVFSIGKLLALLGLGTGLFLRKAWLI